jgi:hypothetical protein
LLDCLQLKAMNIVKCLAFVQVEQFDDFIDFGLFGDVLLTAIHAKSR